MRVKNLCDRTLALCVFGGKGGNMEIVSDLIYRLLISVQFKTCIVFDWVDAVVTGTNPIYGMDVCMHFITGIHPSHCRNTLNFGVLQWTIPHAYKNFMNFEKSQNQRWKHSDRHRWMSCFRLEMFVVISAHFSIFRTKENFTLKNFVPDEYLFPPKFPT